jgi:hypothetical protein
MKRVLKFKRIYQHSETGSICIKTWGSIDYNENACTDFGSFKSPSFLSGYYAIADVQFTGLHDKNGKQIYEGDILKHPICLTGKVIYFQPYAQFTVESNGFLYDLNVNSECEVIGNIYENPELL